MLEQQNIDVLRQQTIAPQQLFINGEWQAASSGQTLDIISPIDGTVMTTTADAGAVVVAVHHVEVCAVSADCKIGWLLELVVSSSRRKDLLI